MLLIRSLLITAITFSVLGCALRPTTDADHVPWYATPPVGSYVELGQELTASRGKRIYVQDGQARSRREIIEWQPYCQFYVERRGAEMREPLVIAPDRFVINKVYRRKDFYTAIAGTQYAFVIGGLFNDNGSSQRTMSTHMEIFSSQQPKVTRLICSRWADPYHYNHVRVHEIQASLGSIAKLVPAS